MEQAARVSGNTVFIHLGKIVESGDTKRIFSDPEDERTKLYISGEFG
jgi:phosphate transport system ATP-binding protein